MYLLPLITGCSHAEITKSKHVDSIISFKNFDETLNTIIENNFYHGTAFKSKNGEHLSDEMINVVNLHNALHLNLNDKIQLLYDLCALASLAR